LGVPLMPRFYTQDEHQEVVDSLTGEVISESRDSAWAIAIAEALNASVTNLTQQSDQTD
jgi:hypothetical protein